MRGGSGLDSVREEHPELTAAVDASLAGLDSVPDTVGSHLVDWMITQRVLDLADLLRCSISLADKGQHGPAFVLMRTALEHTFLDELLLLADRLRQRVEGATPEWVADHRRRLDEGDPDLASVQEIQQRGREIFIVRRGFNLVNGDGERIGTISPYWSFLHHHNPTIGAPSHQADVAAVLSSEEERRDHARQNQTLYHDQLSWKAIKDNLTLNELRDEITCQRIDVHYRFLGGWTHATEAAQSRTRHQRTPCHYCTELVVLYAARLAAIELSNLIRHSNARRPLPEDLKAKLEDTITRARDASAHLWFPDGRPHDYDRWYAVTCLTDHTDPARPTADLNTLNESDIRYYQDPLSRLVNLHSSGTEITTGLTYISPWPRPDRFHP